MSNNGSALTSCGPSTFVNYTGNISSSAQVAFNYDGDGNGAATLVDGVETVFARDADERVTTQTFQPYPTGTGWGNLTYSYDKDGRRITKGGTLATINAPLSATEGYNATDQLATYNGTSTNPDNNENITYDPSWAPALNYTWNARNQLTTRMLEKAVGRDRFSWPWVLLYAVVGNLILFAPAVFLEPDMFLLAYLVAVLIISIIWIAFLVKDAIARRTPRYLPVLSMLLLGWVICAVLATNQSRIRSAARWVVFSKYYKARVLAEPAPPGGELKHTEWDGWGWAGQNTAVYLVFDPADSLSAAAEKGQSGRFSGIPCQVSVVRRLERHWYAVQLYTDELWSRCN